MSNLKLLILLLRDIYRAGVKVAVRQPRAKYRAKATELEEWLEAIFRHDGGDDDDEW